MTKRPGLLARYRRVLKNDAAAGIVLMIAAAAAIIRTIPAAASFLSTLR